MLSTADIIVITKGDIVSHAEREVFRHKVEMINPVARILENQWPYRSRCFEVGKMKFSNVNSWIQ